ncbi:NADPH-dependent 7-cyano-7-deazaguanine reductase QueF [Luteimonas yindakuii]|uniref:NADPH-dependent 7-cyano-7-deazaguanine reductase QueF n=1 Tax=Luteimonas yindakuii TaxID=2565782 RepID=UPI0011076F2C|nr:NADPH-dependent 7-cyano-7-deazaguanine reductase QueF [Luteimonas yindakuii]QCU72775.1 NADPH-dependent 7-cyano-7-deazaguanine reductase QueF [Luteimonas yindakuii]
MTSPHDSSLGRSVAYPAQYDPSLLFAIPRAPSRATLGIAVDATLPFTGVDRWHAYELGWLDGRGKPAVATATLSVPADSPNLVESKSLKLYLNSLNGTRHDSADTVRARIAADLSTVVGAPVDVAFGLPPFDGTAEAATDLDLLDVDIDDYGPPNPTHLAITGTAPVREVLASALLKSNCPVTGQPDWASVRIDWHGPRLDPAGLLRYLVSYREHAGFHEQCVEGIFLDLMRLEPAALSVEARYTRRGGLDINPWRATPGHPAPPTRRELRQ